MTTIKNFATLAIVMGFSIITLSACSNYDFSVNDNVVYKPKALFNRFTAPDPALQQCLKQAIADGKIHAANELTVLNCSHAGITSLQGIGTFYGLQKLKLSSNNISDLNELRTLSALQELYLDENKIIDASPVTSLNSVALLDLTGNPELNCPVEAMVVPAAELKLPPHCVPPTP